VSKENCRSETVSGHEQFYLNDPRLESVFLLCEAFDVPVAVHTGWDNPHFNAPALFADIAGKHPKLKIVNCHLWYPKIDYCYEVTRDYQNIYYDIPLWLMIRVINQKSQRCCTELPMKSP